MHSGLLREHFLAPLPARAPLPDFFTKTPQYRSLTHAIRFELSTGYCLDTRMLNELDVAIGRGSP